MKTVTYDEIKNLAARLAGRPPDKLPVADAELLRDFIGDHLPRVWNREAWPELCNGFVTATLANGEFTKNDATQGDVLAIFYGGNPLTTYGASPLNDWTEADAAVRVLNPGSSSNTLYVEFQAPVTVLPAFGAAGLGATTLPERFRYPLARFAAADLVEDEDPIKAERLRGRAEVELIQQASRFSPPWWRRGRVRQ